MALGNFGLNDFEPKASNTAASILTATSTAEHKKEKVLQLRLDSDMLTTFKEICEARGGKGSMSIAVRNFILEAIATNGSICNFKE